MVYVSRLAASRCLFALVALGYTVAQAHAQAPAAPENLVPTRIIHAITFGEPELRDLPGTRNIWALMETADPFVTVNHFDNGGLYLGEPNLLGSYGSSWTQVTFLMDGLDITDPERTGTPLAYPDPQGLAQMQISSVLPTHDAIGPATRVTLVPRAPTGIWRGQFEVSQLSAGLQPDTSRKNPPVIAEFGHARDVSVSLGGPIGPRSGLFASTRFASSSRFERGGPAEYDSRLGSGFVHAVSAPDPSTRYRLVASLDRVRHPFAGRARYADRNVSARDVFSHLHGTWEMVMRSGATWTATLGWQRGTIGAPEAPPGTALFDRLIDGPALEIAMPSGGARRRTGGVVRFDAPEMGSKSAAHSLSGGLSFSRTSSVLEAMPDVRLLELIDGVPARAWDFAWGGSEVNRRGSEFAAWVSDRMSLFSTMALEFGARAELVSASAATNPTSITWNSVQPRAQLTWNVTGGGGLIFRVGYTKNQLRLPLNYLGYGDTSYLAGRVYRWDDSNGDRQLQGSELGPLVASTGPGASAFHPSRIDPDLRPSVGDDFAFGFEARVSRQWRIRLTGTQRRQWHMAAPVNTGVTLADYDVISLPDRGDDFFNPIDDRTLEVYNRHPASFGKDATLLTNPQDRHRGHQIGVAIEFERVFDGRWYMRLGGTASRSDGLAGNRGFRVTENDYGVLGELFLNPNARTYASGRQFTERGYQVKWSGGFVAGGLHVGIIARYQDGQHFSRMVLVPALNQGLEAVQAYTRGHSRFTYTPSLDARVSQALRFAGLPVSVVFEGYNLLNMGIEVEEDPTVTRFFRQFVMQQPTRAVRLGFQLSF